MAGRMTSKKIRLRLLWLLLILLYPQLIAAHVFRLYSGTPEELKENIAIVYSSSSLNFQYTGEYYGQLAAHIRFMMDTDQDHRVTVKEMNRFMFAYDRMWDLMVEEKMLTFDRIGYSLRLEDFTFPNLRDYKLSEPLSFSMRFKAEKLKIKTVNGAFKHSLEISQRLLFLVGQVFINIAKDTAAFTNEQENAIARFCQVKITADEKIHFTSCFPGYVDRRKKNVIKGIFFDETSIHIQFLPYPKIKAKFYVVNS